MGRVFPSPQCRPRTCDTHADLRRNFVLFLPFVFQLWGARCIERTVFHPGGCFGEMLHDHTMMRQGSRPPAASPGCRKPGLVRSVSVLAIQSNYPDVSLGLLLERPGCLTSPWSPGTFWYAVGRLTCLHLSEASSFHAIASCYVLRRIWHNKDDVVTGRRKQRVICWFSRAKHQAESLRSAEAEESITLPLCLNMCLIVAYFWYFSCVNSSNIYNAVDHVKKEGKRWYKTGTCSHAFMLNFITHF